MGYNKISFRYYWFSSLLFIIRIGNWWGRFRFLLIFLFFILFRRKTTSSSLEGELKDLFIIGPLWGDFIKFLFSNFTSTFFFSTNSYYISSIKLGWGELLRRRWRIFPLPFWFPCNIRSLRRSRNFFIIWIFLGINKF